MSGIGKAWLKRRNRVRREEVMVHSGSHSRPGIGSLHPEDEQPRRSRLHVQVGSGIGSDCKV